MSYFYILEITPLSTASFADIFSHYAGFFLFMVSFAVQKLLGLIRSPFVYFCFCFNYSRRWIQKKKKILLRLMSKSVLLFSFGNFMVIDSIFRSFAHF